MKETPNKPKIHELPEKVLDEIDRLHRIVHSSKSTDEQRKQAQSEELAIHLKYGFCDEISDDV